MQPEPNDKQLTGYPEAPDIESSTRRYALRFSGGVGRWFLDVQKRGTLSLIAKAGLSGGDLTVLDVGGGHGQNAYLANELGHALTVVGSTDACADLIAADVSAGRIRFARSGLLDLPFEDGSFDVVLCYRVMAHIADWRGLVRELSRVGRSLVIVDFASARSVNALSEPFFNMKKSFEADTRHYRLHRPPELVDSFNAVGANYVASYKQFFFPMAIHRAMKAPGLSSGMESVCRIFGLTALLGSPVLAGFRPVDRLRNWRSKQSC